MKRLAWTVNIVFLVEVSSAQRPLPTKAVGQTWKFLQAEPSRADLFEAAARRHGGRDGYQVFAFPHSFLFPTNAERDIDGKIRTNSWFGIDISHHNGPKFPIESLRRQKVAFVYTKATQGTDYADETFAERWPAIKALPTDQRIPRGAYHFLSSDKSMSGTAQADRFLAYIALHGGLEDGDLRPAVDLEWDMQCGTCVDRWSNRSPEELVVTVTVQWGGLRSIDKS